MLYQYFAYQHCYYFYENQNIKQEICSIHSRKKTFNNEEELFYIHNFITMSGFPRNKVSITIF